MNDYAPGYGRGLRLLEQAHLRSLDREPLEAHARELATTAYLGNSVSLCRVLGRYHMYVDTTDVGFAAHLLMGGFWETWLTIFMARRLMPGMRVADVGANHGYYTLLMGDMVGPQGRVAAVEPNAKIADLLRKSVAINGFADRTQVFEQAACELDDESIWMRLPIGEPKNGHRVAGPDAPTMPGDTVVQARAGRLATMLGGWDRLDFAKIDVEGAEETAIAGLMPILERDKPDLVVEFNAPRCAAPREFIDRLESLYGRIRHIEGDSEAHDTPRETLFDASRIDDWLLFLSVRD
ncbi:MAG TPA: FkbM family methyltransferase [Caulobacteraceae bacterium]|jgi:FkbM family methyltransferase|nr:FkbM family methyltransferase [Caulobacteraceae bacterium]